MTVHQKKCREDYFEAVKKKVKTFEVRKEDEETPFEVGDVLILEEVKESITGDVFYTGQMLATIITYVLRDFEGLAPGYVVLGIKK